MNLNNAGYSEIAALSSFEFETVVSILFGCDVKKAQLKEIYSVRQDNQIKGDLWDLHTARTIGVYALFLGDTLLKIGQAADYSSGVFHRMSQYYRGTDGKCKYIDKHNKDCVRVEYFNLDSKQECWAAEKLLQGIAFFMGEEMPWEEKERRSKHQQ